jgi:cell division protein FtsL
MNNARQAKSGEPVIRLRIMLIGVCVIVIAMMGPLALVWKQSYINQTSIRLEAKADTLNAINREIAALKLRCSNLSSTARIERLAKAQGLEYPSSSQIEVIKVSGVKVYKERRADKFFDMIKGSLLRERG